MNKEFLYKLLNTVSVSGNEEANQENILAYTKDFADRQDIDAVGNVVSIINPEADCKVLLCGHIDEIGFRVTNIDGGGIIHVLSAGGVRSRLYAGTPMQIIHEEIIDGKIVRHKVNGVGVVDEGKLRSSEFRVDDVLIDIGATSKEEAEKYVSVGDSVCADTEVHELLNNNFTCRALDDKTGAFVIVEAAKRAKEKGVEIGVYACTTVGEETSGRGAGFVASEVNPDCVIAVDVTWASDCPGANPFRTGEVVLGKGPVICKSGMVNKKMNLLLEDVAKDKNIPIQIEVAGGRTGTDGDTVMGKSIPMALISIPNRYMHSSVEVSNWDDLENCIELLSEFLLRIDSSFNYNPIG